MNCVHRLPFGAEIIASNRAHFRWWAPDLETASLEIEQTDVIPMQPTGAGWFECEAAISAGARYRYRVNADLAVPDPASRLQSNDVHGWSVLLNPRDFIWRQENWRGRAWPEIIIYELHAGCYDGFSGVENKLRELAQLGITAIELMPIADFRGRHNWGYDGVLPFAPATAYGTPQQLKHLIDTAHGLGLCVYLDVVYNHFGPDGNYLHTYASKFFDAQQASPWGPAIDFSQPQVRDFFTQNALYWLLEYRFDGLRIDAAHAISDPGWLDEMATAVRAAVEPDRHVHLMLENEHNRACHLRATANTKYFDGHTKYLDGQGFNAQWNDDWHNTLHVLLTGEHEGYYANYIEQPAQKLARSLAEGFVYQGEPSPTHNNESRGTPSGDLPPTAFIHFLQNHDQVGNRAYGERLTLLASPDNLRAAVVLQLLAPTIPLLFMGEEFGSETPFLFFTDFCAELGAAVRAGRRQEFAAFAAFQDAQQRERIPDPNALETFERSIPTSANAEKAQVFRDFYRHLLQLRRDHIVPRLAVCRSIGAHAIADKAVVARWQFGDGAVLCIAVNFGDRAVNFLGFDNDAENVGEKKFALDTLRPPFLFECPAGAGNHVLQGKLTAHGAIVMLQSSALLQSSAAPKSAAVPQSAER